MASGWQDLPKNVFDFIPHLCRLCLLQNVLHFSVEILPLIAGSNAVSVNRWEVDILLRFPKESYVKQHLFPGKRFPFEIGMKF